MKRPARSLATVEVDEIARLARVPADMTVHAVERELAARGLTLGASVRRKPTASIGELLREAGASDRSPMHGRLLDACLGIEARLGDGRDIVWRAVPRKAVGPDWRWLLFGRRRSPAAIRAVTLAVAAAPEVSRGVAFVLSDRRAALRLARVAARSDVRPASWWVSGRTLCAELEGPAAQVDCDQRILEALVQGTRGRQTESTACPAGAARFVSWSVLLRSRATVSQMTLDGGCLHDRAEGPAALPTRLRRALRAAGIGA